MEYSFNVFNTLAPDGEVLALKRLLKDTKKTPVIACVGSDLSVGDSLGPIVGTKLKESWQDSMFMFMERCKSRSPRTKSSIRMIF